MQPSGSCGASARHAGAQCHTGWAVFLALPRRRAPGFADRRIVRVITLGHPCPSPHSRHPRRIRDLFSGWKRSIPALALPREQSETPRAPPPGWQPAPDVGEETSAGVASWRLQQSAQAQREHGEQPGTPHRFVSGKKRRTMKGGGQSRGFSWVRGNRLYIYLAPPSPAAPFWKTLRPNVFRTVDTARHLRAPRGDFRQGNAVAGGPADATPSAPFWQGATPIQAAPRLFLRGVLAACLPIPSLKATKVPNRLLSLVAFLFSAAWCLSRGLGPDTPVRGHVDWGMLIIASFGHAHFRPVKGLDPVSQRAQPGCIGVSSWIPWHCESMSPPPAGAHILL